MKELATSNRYSRPWLRLNGVEVTEYNRIRDFLLNSVEYDLWVRLIEELWDPVVSSGHFDEER